MEYFTNLIGQIKNGLNKEKKMYLYIGAAVLCVLIIAFSEGLSYEKKADNIINNKDYEMQFIETECLEEFLENIKGAGKVRVLITYEASTERVFAVDTDENSDFSNNSYDEINRKSKHIIIKDDDGEKGLIIKEIYPKVRGVAVICEGSENVLVRKQITDALCSLLDIKSNQISISV